MKNQVLTICFIVIFFSFFFAGNAIGQSNFLESTNGPEGGAVKALAIDSIGRIFAGTDGSGLFLSENGGESWSKIALPDERYSVVNALAIDNSDNIFVGSSSDVILRSTDNGVTWDELRPGNFWGAISITITSAQHVFVGTYGEGIFRSKDNGDNWEHVLQPYIENGIHMKYYIYSIAEAPDNTLYASSGTNFDRFNKGVYKSIDAGDTWQITALDESAVANVAVTPNGVVLASVSCNNIDNPKYIFGFYHSEDGGYSWERSIGQYPPCQVLDWALDSDGYIYAGTYQNSGVWKSEDNGLSFNRTGGELLFKKTVYALILDHDEHFYAGTSVDGVHKSLDDTETWSRKSNGLIATDIKSVAALPSGRVFAGAAGIGIPYTDNKGIDWMPSTVQQQGYDTDVYDTIIIDSANRIYAGGPYVRRSFDEGTTWTEEIYVGAGFRCFAIDPLDNVYAGTTNGIYITNDHGESWIEPNGMQNPNGLKTYRVEALGINSLGYLFAGTYGKGLWKFENDVDGWQLLSDFRDKDGNPIIGNPNEAYVYSLVINSEDTIFVGVDWPIYGTFRSTDDGITFYEVLDPPVMSIVINAEGNIYAGSETTTIYYSTDDGDSWEEAYSESQRVQIRDLAFDADGYLYAGTWGAGVFRSVESTTGEDILMFFDKSVENGTLSGLGSGWFAQLRLGLMRGMLEIARECIERDRINAACFTLQRAYLRTDGLTWPMDYVKGDATDELADMILQRRSSLGCE